jgi:hypothetical protein
MTDATEAPAPDRMAAARAARAAKLAAANATEAPAVELPAGTALHVEKSDTAPPVNLAVTEDFLGQRAEAQRVAAEAAELARADQQNKPTSNARAAAKLATADDLKARAARQRADAGPAEPAKMVAVRITKAGNAKISMGVHVAGVADACYEWKEETSLPEDTAIALEERGFVEIL